MSTITFASGSLRLEGMFTPGDDGVAVLCHPHPLYGGNMHNNVVAALDEGFRRCGYATLRFNFRGVGASEGGYEGGAGEGEDVRAAAAEALRLSGAKQLTLAGYSFGAMMVVQVGPTLAEVDRLVIVAPPLSFGGLGPLARSTQDKLILAGDRDGYCSVPALESAMSGVAEPKQHRILAGADHFFAGYESAISDAVEVWGRQRRS
jgi:alpha/beta superfamily hydrolase